MKIMTNKTSLRKSKLALAISTSLLLSSNLMAAEQNSDAKLEVIEVTAQKRVESIQEVPMSITAFNGDMIEDSGIKNLSQLSDYVPNLTISDGAINTNIYMRGVGSGNNRAFEQSVGMFIDGIYMGRSRQFRSPFLDLERAEILRGPQGILFGKNTIAGALNLSTAKAYAGDDFEGSVTAEYEPEYNEQIISAIFSGSLSDEFGLRLALKDGSSDGYMENTFLDREEMGTDEQIVRLSANWQPNDDLNVHLKVEHAEYETVGSTAEIIGLTPLDPLAGFIAGSVLPATDADFDTTANYKRSSDTVLEAENSETESDNVSLNIDYGVGEGTLTLVTGLSSYDHLDHKDVDYLPMTFLNTSDSEEFEQISQEIRYATSGSNKFDYITGVYYQQSDLDLNFWSHVDVTAITPVLMASFADLSASLLNPALPAELSWLDIGLVPEGFSRTTEFNQEVETLSAFFQGTYSITDDLDVIFGGRYTKETKDVTRKSLIVQPGQTTYDPSKIANMNGLVTAAALQVAVTLPEYDNSRTEEHFTPSVKLKYQLNDDVMLYGTIEQGFKSGGFNANADATAENQEFEEESAVGMEFGLKSDLMDGGARLNLAVFRTEFDDLQVTTWNGFGFEVGNAAESITQGIEVDGIILLNDNLTLSGSVSYLDSYYKSYPTGPCTAYAQKVEGKSVCDLTDKSTPFAPEISASLFLEYTKEISQEMEFSTILNLNYTDEFFYDIDLDENLKQEAVTKVNLTLALVSIDDEWAISIIGKNLTNEQSFAAGLDVPLVAGGYMGYADAPRTISIQGTFRF